MHHPKKEPSGTFDLTQAEADQIDGQYREALEVLSEVLDGIESVRGKVYKRVQRIIEPLIPVNERVYTLCDRLVAEMPRDDGAVNRYVFEIIHALLDRLNALLDKFNIRLKAEEENARTQGKITLILSDSVKGLHGEHGCKA